jgi:hypothetical protein
VVAIDNSDNLSEPSLFIDSSVDTNVIYLSTDGVSSIVMPDEVNDLLRSGYNKYGVPLTVRMTERPLSTASEIIREVKYSFIRSDTGEEVLDLAFSKPRSYCGPCLSNCRWQCGPRAGADKRHSERFITVLLQRSHLD